MQNFNHKAALVANGVLLLALAQLALAYPLLLSNSYIESCVDFLREHASVFNMIKGFNFYQACLKCRLNPA